jgi:hypothetical protein
VAGGAAESARDAVKPVGVESIFSGKGRARWHSPGYNSHALPGNLKQCYDAFNSIFENKIVVPIPYILRNSSLKARTAAA